MLVRTTFGSTLRSRITDEATVNVVDHCQEITREERVCIAFALPVQDAESLPAHFVIKQSFLGISAVIGADVLAVA
jgi:hypothetical protein